MVYNVHNRNYRSALRASHYRAFLNGREVTHRCFYADVRRGVVRLYVHDEHGSPFLRDGAIVTEERRGRVRVMPGRNP